MPTKTRKQTTALPNGGTDLERFVATLPQIIDDAEEFEWIQSHPAITRHLFIDTEITEAAVSLADLESPPNGRCPSQRAARMLMLAVKHPQEVLKTSMLQYKTKLTSKKGNPTGDEVNANDLAEEGQNGTSGKRRQSTNDGDDLAEIRRYMSEIKHLSSPPLD
jgi:hypothetical protein